MKDHNSMIIKICLFFFSFGLYFTINALFFTDETMYKIYEDHGMFNIIIQMTHILYSTIISVIIGNILKTLSLSEKNINELKYIEKPCEYSKKMNKLIKCLNIKFYLFFILSFIFLGLFWYYLSSFYAVYKNTQLLLFKDTIISFITSLLYPLVINLLPGIFRIPSLKKNNIRHKECLYIISKIIQLI